MTTSSGRVVDGFDLVVDGRAAQPLGRQHRDRGHDVAGAGERSSGGGQPTERPARRDADRLAEAELVDVAVERPAVEAVVVDDAPRARARPGTSDRANRGSGRPRTSSRAGRRPRARARRRPRPRGSGRRPRPGRPPRARSRSLRAGPNRRDRRARSRRAAARSARGGCARCRARRRPAGWPRGRGPTVAGSERRPRISSNGRSARDSRFDSIGAPTVAPWVVIEPWSNPPSTSPVSCSAQMTTGHAAAARRARPSSRRPGRPSSG